MKKLGLNLVDKIEKESQMENDVKNSLDEESPKIEILFIIDPDYQCDIEIFNSFDSSLFPKYMAYVLYCIESNILTENLLKIIKDNPELVDDDVDNILKQIQLYILNIDAKESTKKNPNLVPAISPMEVIK